MDTLQKSSYVDHKVFCTTDINDNRASQNETDSSISTVKIIPDAVIANINDSFVYVEQDKLKIVIMRKNGYVNCTNICRSAGKSFCKWKNLSISKAILRVKDNEELIIRVTKGRKLAVSGFYVRQDIVQYIAEWIDIRLTDNIIKLINCYNRSISNKDIYKELNIERPDAYKICPFMQLGVCYYKKKCQYLHGDKCKICGLYVLHPTDESSRANHLNTCLESRKKLHIFKRSNDKICGICIETVYDKDISEQLFGILPNCQHVFCLSCIRRWMDTIRNTITENTCPECRTVSPFVVPNRYWIEDKYEKRLIVNRYKKDHIKKSTYKHKNVSRESDSIYVFMLNDGIYLANF